MNLFSKCQKWYKSLPDKKKYLEVITAALSIPVLLTVIISNIDNIREKNKKEETHELKTEKQIVSLIPIEVSKDLNPTKKPELTQEPQITHIEECIKKVGPIELVSPSNDEVITADPICLQIEQQSDKYCSIVWSYKLDDDAFSEYSDKQICLYNLSAGKKNLYLRVKSTVSDDEKLIRRIFNVSYQTENPISITPQISPSISN